MITVFLTDDATDALIEDFEKNGFPKSFEPRHVSDLLIELTEISLTLRCQKLGDEEIYQKIARFFPPTVNLRESEEIQVSESKLAESHETVQDFLAGEIEIQNIPTDEDHSWLRHAVLLCRLVMPYVQQHLSDETYNEEESGTGVYITFTEDGIRTRVVSGEERPPLIYARLARDGCFAEEPGRYYEDEIFSGDKLKSVIKELEGRPQFLDLEGNGEKADYPPKLLEEYQCGRLLFDGRMRKNEFGEKIVPVTFSRKDFLWQHPPKPNSERIYITADTLLKLPEIEVPIKLIPAELQPETIVEIIDAAFTCIIETSGINLKDTKLSLYNRFGLPMHSPVRAEAAGVCERAKLFLDDGRFGSDGEGYLGDVAFSLLFGYRKLLGALIAADWFTRHGKSEGEQSGILIEADGTKAVIRRVTGKQRPQLIYSGLKGDRAVGRAYPKDDECGASDVGEAVTFQAIMNINKDPKELLAEKLRQTNGGINLENEIAQGNPQAMKLLAEQLLHGAPNAEDKKKALLWYQKAAALLPDDDDLEFEIFMLKMELNNRQ